MSAPILSITDLSVSLPAGADRAEAVSGVSLTVNANEIVCLVGESGSGKSMIAHTILGLLPPGVAVAGGAVTLCGRDVAAATEAELRGVGPATPASAPAATAGRGRGSPTSPCRCGRTPRCGSRARAVSCGRSSSGSRRSASRATSGWRPCRPSPP
ncbi:hypothetical protein MOF7_09175 [Methylobacterium oryzae]